MKRAGEVMLRLDAFPYIPYWFTLRQALAELGEAEARENSSRKTPWTILIFSAQNQFLGIVQRPDILRGLNSKLQGETHGLPPPYPSSPTDPNLSRLGFSEQRAIQKLKEHLERPIADFMTPVQVTADLNDPILLVIYLMIDHGLTFVPVMKLNEIVGVVYIEDALNEVIASVI